MKQRILLADDHALMRAGMRALIDGMGHAEVVAEAGTGLEAVALVAEHQPDIVLMDISMPELNGLEALARIRRRDADVRVIMLSMHADEEYIVQSLRLGVAGYLLKDSATMELELALRSVAAGETYLSPAISRQVVDDYLGRLADSDGPLDRLTARQRQVLQLVAEGHSTRQCAELLNVSVKTVESHRANLMDRLGVRDLPGLVRFAVRHGLVSAEG
ncbi:response regulator transcription factor [Wenzhouxiangella sp. AB-CW3]|uniref:response regulator n=1 Tax=Wenzhouxiangella sp. AB-CW3 TaxID=2771012 RepID=UPI00168AF22D|nr:response regulator transcription factor [Wenzhouxiangella sp. AB-CW3]QOC21209.1 response regulator transcription factor [Wenzhouxiangella sp. AB-CW3]